MYSRTPSGKASKGSVSISSSNNRLQFNFRFGGKRHFVSVGLSDTPHNRKWAEGKAKELEIDILANNVDTTWAKYKPGGVIALPVIKAPDSPGLVELWESFLEFKRPQCSENTMIGVYNTYTGYLNRLPSHNLKDAEQIREWVLENLPLDSGKRFITRLSACCDWAVNGKRISSNPFQGMAAEIKLPKSENEDNDIDPLTAEERDSIIAAIAENRFSPKSSGFKHSHYAPLVRFLFATGCRPSEAVSLQWKHISPDLRFIHYQQAVIRTSQGRRVRPGLKTQVQRKFPCNQSLQELLALIRPDGVEPESLVLPSIKGSMINTDNFRDRVWKPVLEGLGIRYRKLYQTRHTFITLALDSGKLDAKDVARLVGNTPTVIYEHYAGCKRELFVPEF
jgi:integrase